MARRSGSGDFRVNLSIDPRPEVLAKAILEHSDKFKDWRPVWRQLIPFLSSGILATIGSGRGPGGENWAAPKEPYVRRKAHAGFGRTDLVKTGAMLSQLSSASGGTIRIGRGAVSFGTDKPYARAVNFGNIGKGVGSRVFMGWTPSMRGAAEKFFAEHVQNILQGIVAESAARKAA